MLSIEYATEQYRSYWHTLDKFLSESELTLKIRDRRAYIIKSNDKPIGIMRYNMFWDVIPFLTLIYFEESFRGKGYGTKAMKHWENEMRQLGYKLVMTSTMVEESSQRFYRKLGYKDCGCLVMDMKPYVQTMEMFLMKQL